MIEEIKKYNVKRTKAKKDAKGKYTCEGCYFVQKDMCEAPEVLYDHCAESPEYMYVQVRDKKEKDDVKRREWNEFLFNSLEYYGFDFTAEQFKQLADSTYTMQWINILDKKFEVLDEWKESNNKVNVKLKALQKLYFGK